MQTQTVFFSRFRDSLTPGALPLTEQPETPEPTPRPSAFYSLHVTDMGLVITYRWTSPDDGATWEQAAPLFAETVQVARENVPPGAQRVWCPPEFGIELYEVVS